MRRGEGTPPYICIGEVALPYDYIEGTPPYNYIYVEGPAQIKLCAGPVASNGGSLHSTMGLTLGARYSSYWVSQVEKAA